MDLAANFALAGIYSASTIWYRMTMFGAATMSGAQYRAETARMMSEKFAAGVEGGLGAVASSMRVASKAARGKLNAGDLPDAASAIMDAGLRPAMVRARSNSRRLGRKSRKR